MVKVSITKMPLRKSQVINILRHFIRKIFQNKLNRLKEKINEDEEGGEEMMALAKEGVLPKMMKTLLMMILMQIILYLKILQA